jgi:hypothetical protein
MASVLAIARDNILLFRENPVRFALYALDIEIFSRILAQLTFCPVQFLCLVRVTTDVRLSTALLIASCAVAVAMMLLLIFGHLFTDPYG